MESGLWLGRLRLVAYVALFGSMLGTLAFAAGGVAGLTSSFCNIITGIARIIGLLALFMFILGAVLYAAAHFLPAAGNLKGSLQGWGMGMLVGGVVMVVLYLLAPFIITTVISFSNSSITPAIALPSCS